MSKRGRRRLIIALVVLGVPALVSLGVIGFVASGGLENRLEREYAARFPGRLVIGRLELAGTAHAVAHDLELYGPAGGEPVVRIAAANLYGGLFPPRLERLALTGLKLRFDRDGVEFVRALLALPRTAAETTPARLRLDVDGEIAVGQRMVLAPLKLALVIDRGSLDGRLDAQLGGQPFALVMAPAPGGDPQRQRSRIGVVAATVDLGDLFAAITALGFLPNQDSLLAWLPRRATLAGTELVVDPAGGTLSGHAVPSWDGGHGSTDLLLDKAGLHLTRATAEDAQLGGGVTQPPGRAADHVVLISIDGLRPAVYLDTTRIAPADADAETR